MKFSTLLAAAASLLMGVGCGRERDNQPNPKFVIPPPDTAGRSKNLINPTAAPNPPEAGAGPVEKAP